MARQVMPFIGAAVGFMIGGPAGAQLGYAAGAVVGNYVDPQRLSGPRLGEGQVQTAQEGAYRPIVFGTACVGGNVIYRGPRVVREHEESQGKGGGPVLETDRGYRTFAIRICEGPIKGISRIWENEKLVYDVRPESEIPSESVEYAKRFTLYLGGEEQLPDPALEAFKGVGNVNAHNGTAYVVFPDYDLTDLRDMVPNYRFEVTTVTTTTSGGGYVPNIVDGMGHIYGANSGFSNHQFLPPAGPTREIAPGTSTLLLNFRNAGLISPPGTPRYKLWVDGVVLFDSGPVASTDFVNYALDVNGAEEFFVECMTYNPSDPEVPGPANSQFQFNVKSSEETLAELWPDIFGDTSDSQVTLAQIVAWCHNRVGQAKYDVSELDDVVDGVVLADGYTARDAVTTLLGMYFADAVECDQGSGYKINYIKRGKPAVMTLTIDDLVDEPEEAVREDALERPRALHLHYQSPTIGYAPAKATITRFSPDVAGHLVGEVSIATPISFKNQDEAWQRTDILMREIWTQVSGKRELSVSDALLKLVPTDEVFVYLREKVTRGRILKTELADGVIKLELINCRQGNYTSNVTGPVLPAPEPPPPSIAGPTISAAIDEAGLRDFDDQLGYYVAASGISPGWGGGAVQMSRDAGTSYSTVATFNRSNRCVMGELLDTVTAASPHYTDSTNVVSVRLYWEGDAIESLTEQQFLSEGGAFALEWDDGGDVRWEILQHRDAEQDDDDPQVFHLSHLARGRLNTTPAEHVAGARLVMLDRAQFVVAQSSMIGQDLTFRAVSLNASPETATPETIAYAGRTQREWEVAHILSPGVVADQLAITVIPRHRFGTEVNPVRSANWDGFLIAATDGSNTASIDTTSATHTFDVTGWGSPITVTVAQLNRITGAGPTVTEQF